MGKGGGKSKGKIAFTLAFAVVGGVLGAVGAFHGAFTFGTGALMGMSVGSTLWSVTHKPNMGNLNYDTDYSNDDYSRFNQTSNDINPDAVIPVIYGTRKFGGLQTWYNTANGSRNLEKDVVICYAGVDDVYNVCANEELIRDDTNIYIYNDRYIDARVRRHNDVLYLYANGKEQSFELGYISDEHYDARNSLLSIVLDKIKQDAGDGWKIDGALKDDTKKGISANSMKFAKGASKNCYVDPLDKERENAVLLDDRGYGIGTYELHQNESPDNYTEVGSYAGCAWIRSNLTASQRISGSNPTINSYVRGMKVKVWKNGVWVTEYSENPAWIIRDFLTNKIYGTGQWISEDLLDINSFISVANYCDEEIEYKDADGNIQKCPRYRLNIVLDSKKQPIEHLSSMLATFGGFFSLGEKIALKVEKAETPVYAFDDSTIIKDSLSIGQTALQDTPNRYKIGYFDPNQNWTEVKVVVEDLELQHEQDDQINEKIVTLAGCTSQNQALRLGRLYRDINKICSLTCSFSVATQGMMLECGDVITVSYNNIFTNMPFRITEIQETKDGIYQLTCRQYNPSLYDDSLGATIINPSYSNIESPLLQNVPVVTNLTLAEEYSVNTDNSLTTNIIATWDDNKFANFSSYSVSLSTNGIDYKTIGSLVDNVIRIPNCNVGQTYYVCVQNINNAGITSAPTIQTIRLIGDGVTPTTPTNLQATLTNVFTIKWDKTNNTNIRYYEVRTDGNFGSEINLLGRTENNELSTNLVKSRSGTIYVYAVSIYNIKSIPAQLTYNYPAQRVTRLDVTVKMQGIEMKVDSIPSNYLGVHWFIDGVNSDYDYKTNNSTEFYSCSSGVYNINACYYDYFGEAPKYDTVGNGKMVTVSAYIDPALIEEKSLTAKLLDDTTQQALKKANSAAQQSDVQDIVSQQIDPMGKSISTIVANLNKSPNESGYSAITQLAGGIQLTVQKGAAGGGSFINLTNKTLTLDSNLITIGNANSIVDIKGTTITNNMLAGSISADKLAINTLSAITANIGEISSMSTDKLSLTVISNNGGRVYSRPNTSSDWVLRVRWGMW